MRTSMLPICTAMEGRAGVGRNSASRATGGAGCKRTGMGDCGSCPAGDDAGGCGTGALLATGGASGRMTGDGNGGAVAGRTGALSADVGVGAACCWAATGAAMTGCWSDSAVRCCVRSDGWGRAGAGCGMTGCAGFASGEGRNAGGVAKVTAATGRVGCGVCGSMVGDNAGPTGRGTGAPRSGWRAGSGARSMAGETSAGVVGGGAVKSETAGGLSGATTGWAGAGAGAACGALTWTGAGALIAARCTSRVNEGAGTEAGGICWPGVLATAGGALPWGNAATGMALAVSGLAAPAVRWTRLLMKSDMVSTSR